MKKLKSWIIGEYFFIVTLISFKLSRRKANRLHKLTGKRWHVISEKGKTSAFVVVDNSFINRYNRYVTKKSERIDIDKLLKMSFYTTPCKSVTRSASIKH